MKATSSRKDVLKTVLMVLKLKFHNSAFRRFLTSIFVNSTMGPRHQLFYLFLICACLKPLCAQKSLRISFMRFGSPKTREVFVGDRLEYRLKGGRKFQTGVVATMNDSLMVLASEKVIPFSQLRALRIRKNKYHLKLFQTIFLTGAFGYPLLVSANYFIVPNSQGLTMSTAVVSGSFFIGAFIVHEMNIYRVRINRHKQLLVLDRDYEHLGDSLKSSP